MNNDYVQQYGTLENTHWWFLVRQKIILQTLRRNIVFEAKQPLKILNVGAAAGASSKWLSSLGKVTSVEPDIFFVEHLRKQNIDVVQASADSLPFETEQFDLVCAFDVIEHVKDDSKAMQEFFRVCKSTGYVCITVPAYQWLWSKHDVVNQHFRRYSSGQIFRLSNNVSSAKLIYCSYFNTVLFLPILLVRALQKIARRSRATTAHSDFETYKSGSLQQRFCYQLFSLELVLLRTFKLPFGVSFLALFSKKA
ncbi:MAG: hypothetical protein RLY16_1830 [Bacteroidota bacterium]|jgi:SAM-dependent methyltransferase